MSQCRIAQRLNKFDAFFFQSAQFWHYCASGLGHYTVVHRAPVSLKKISLVLCNFDLMTPIGALRD